MVWKIFKTRPKKHEKNLRKKFRFRQKKFRLRYRYQNLILNSVADTETRFWSYTCLYTAQAWCMHRQKKNWMLHYSCRMSLTIIQQEILRIRIRKNCKTYDLALTGTMCFEVNNSVNRNRDSLHKEPFVNYVLQHVGICSYLVRKMLTFT